MKPNYRLKRGTACRVPYWGGLIKVKDANSVLVFSYIGYLSKEVKVGSQSTIQIRMDVSSQELNDVVVVGYGTQKRSELTKAVVQTTGAETKKSNAVSLSNSLAARMAGCR